MADNAKNTTTTVIPTLRYRDAPAAIEWLCEAFGFERHLVVPGESETIAHAQLVFASGEEPAQVIVQLGGGHRAVELFGAFDAEALPHDEE